MSARRPPKPAKKAKSSKPEKLPSTIGDNPLDDLVPAGPVKQVALTRHAKQVAHGAQATTVLTITVPQSLASQVEHILAVSPELSFDQLMTSALSDVLQAIKGRQRAKKPAASSVKDLATTLYRRS
jgi:hypothetical protein